MTVENGSLWGPEDRRRDLLVLAFLLVAGAAFLAGLLVGWLVLG